MKFISRSERQTHAFARRYAATLRGGEVVALVGELGSGKTTFVRELAKALGIREPVRSPTFTLMHVHRVWKSPKQEAGSRRSRRIMFLVHVDAYRLGNREELAGIGFDDYAGRPDMVTLVEWADRVGLEQRADRILYFAHGRTASARTISEK